MEKLSKTPNNVQARHLIEAWIFWNGTDHLQNNIYQDTQDKNAALSLSEPLNPLYLAAFANKIRHSTS